MGGNVPILISRTFDEVAATAKLIVGVLPPEALAVILQPDCHLPLTVRLCRASEG